MWANFWRDLKLYWDNKYLDIYPSLYFK
jgi:hypothetical protein